MAIDDAFNFGGGLTQGTTRPVAAPSAGFLGQWAPNLPGANTNYQPGSNTGGWQATINPAIGQMPDWMLGGLDFWKNEKNAAAGGAYLGAQVPLLQLQQNNLQYAKDFNEAQRRWNQEQGWSQGRDRFNMDLATRQQQSAETQAQIAAQQWRDQFAHTQGQDMWGRGFSERQQGHTEGQDIWGRGFAERQQGHTEGQDIWGRGFAERQQGHTEGQDIWGRGFSEKQLEQQGALERERNASMELQSRYAAFGRAQAPSASFVGSWR